MRRYQNSMTKYKNIIGLAFSGGVDSSISALLLHEAGYDVHALYLDMWKWKNDNSHLAAVETKATELTEKIPLQFSHLDAREKMHQIVVQEILEGLKKGRTPNPCVRCNPLVKFKLLQEFADLHGIKEIATGHYAQVIRQTDGTYSLFRAQDGSKDQSYMLCYLTQSILARTKFPLGKLQKSDIKTMACELGLSVAQQPESQDLCFMDGLSYQEFIEHFAQDEFVPGEIVDCNGIIIGQHKGLAFYTIGQRKGIRIAAGQPYYVIEKDIKHNRMVVGFLSTLGKRKIEVVQVNWIRGNEPAQLDCDVKIRYRAKSIPAHIQRMDEKDKYQVIFQDDVDGITPGQYAVFYQKEEMLGGGMINQQ